MNVQERDIIIHPVKGKNERTIPSKGLLLINSSDLAIFENKIADKGWSRRPFFPGISLFIDEEYKLFVAGPCFGSPAAAVCLERLIVLGAEEVYALGWGGAINKQLNEGDLVLPLKGYFGEGTSRYYTQDEYSEPSKEALEKLQGLLTTKDQEYVTGNGWSTDAPFRESREMLTHLSREYDVQIVDMEISALFTVANFRNISMAALFMVSDLLYEKEWKPVHGKLWFREKVAVVIRALLLGCREGRL